MGENEIVYWDNWLEKDEDIPITKDGYMFKYNITNMHSNEGICNWVCCYSKKKLYAFIKYFILPSVQLTRTIGVKEGTAYSFVLSYDETIGYLDNPILKDYEKQIRIYKSWFKQIENLERKDASLVAIRDFVTKVSQEVDSQEGIYVDLDVFENINSVGETLVNDFEKDGMLDVLEYELELNKEQILDMFNNIDKNQFMIRKVNDILLDRLG